jgi:predicted metal-binding membrane protein
MVVAGITFSEILLLIVVFTIMNVVLLAPVVLALFRAYLEWRENEAIRQSRR